MNEKSTFLIRGVLVALGMTVLSVIGIYFFYEGKRSDLHFRGIIQLLAFLWVVGCWWQCPKISILLASPQRESGRINHETKAVLEPDYPNIPRAWISLLWWLSNSILVSIASIFWYTVYGRVS